MAGGADLVCIQPYAGYYAAPLIDDTSEPPACLPLAEEEARSAPTSQPVPLKIDQHLFFDVNLPTLARLSPSEFGHAIDPRVPTPPGVQGALNAAEQATAAKWGGVLQVKVSDGTTVNTLVLKPPTYTKSGENWAVEAGGVTAESITTSGLTSWGVVDPPGVLWLALDSREKFGFAYANAVYQSKEFGTVRAGLSSSIQNSAWATAVLTDSEWFVGGFASVEAIALKANVQVLSPKVALPGTLGLVNLQTSVAVDGNVGGLGGALGAGVGGKTDGTSLQFYYQVGVIPKVGARGLAIFDLSIDPVQAEKLSAEVAQVYTDDPARQSIEEALASAAGYGSVVDPNFALGGLYLSAILKGPVSRGVGELVQFGKDAGEALNRPLGQLNQEIAVEYFSDPARRSLEAALSSGAGLGAEQDPSLAFGGLYLGAAARVIGRHAADLTRELGEALAPVSEPPATPVAR
ncbi:MAG: hypothetical protein H7Y33_10470 [Cytophagales bacterium]|nr:hypothetical protein [Rhizobacter sp.]